MTHSNLNPPQPHIRFLLNQGKYDYNPFLGYEAVFESDPKRDIKYQKVANPLTGQPQYIHTDKKMWQIAQSIHSCALSKEIGEAAKREAKPEAIAKIIQNHEEVTRTHCHTCDKCFTVSVMYSYHYILYRLGYRDAQKYLNYRAGAYQDENGLNPNSLNGKK